MKLFGLAKASPDAELHAAENELASLNRELAWELSKAAADVVGLVDPTPISDAVSMGMSLIDGDLIGAGLSLISMVPYAGDALAKTTKGARAAKKILKLQKKIAALTAKVRALKGAKASKAASQAIRKAKTKPPASGVCVECAKRAAKQKKNNKSINYGKRKITRQTGSRNAQGAKTRFTSRNFRKNLARETGGVVPGAEAHHVFPRAFEREFSRRGINVNNPRFGSWWEQTSHRSNAHTYNQAWRQFFTRNPNATGEQTVEFGRAIARRYGLDIRF